jgi:hypothetical protein
MTRFAQTTTYFQPIGTLNFSTNQIYATKVCIEKVGSTRTRQGTD